MTAAELHELTRGCVGAGWWPKGLEYDPPRPMTPVQCSDSWWDRHVLPTGAAMRYPVSVGRAADLILAAGLRRLATAGHDPQLLPPRESKVWQVYCDPSGYGSGPTLLHATLAALAAVEGGGK